MTDQLSNQILRKTEEVKELYYHLILLVNDLADKQAEFKQLAEEASIGSLNVNLELGRAMLPLTTRQRALKTTSLLNKMISNVSEETILMYHINILFDPALKQDPLRLLQNLSRRKTIIAVWDGKIQGKYLIYAEPDHPEYRRYPINDLVLISPQNIS